MQTYSWESSKTSFRSSQNKIPCLRYLGDIFCNWDWNRRRTRGNYWLFEWFTPDNKIYFRTFIYSSSSVAFLELPYPTKEERFLRVKPTDTHQSLAHLAIDIIQKRFITDSQQTLLRTRWTVKEKASYEESLRKILIKTKFSARKHRQQQAHQ